MQTLLQDPRCSARMLSKQPAFTLMAVLTLALGVAANRATFFVNATAQQTLDGDWTGEIKLGKETIPLNVYFKRGPDGEIGSVEMLGQKDLALASVRLQSDRLQFELPREPGSFSFDGLLQLDAITGEVRRGTERGSFNLVKIAKIANQTLEQYVGTYEFSPDHLIAISLSPSFGMTFVDYQTGELRNLATSSETTCSFGPAIFSRVPIEARITFTKDERGAVSGLSLQRVGSADVSARRLQFKREEVMFKNGEIMLAGTLVLPNTKAPYPVFVRTHGSGRALRNIAQGEWLAYYGVAMLTYDKRGSGKSTGDVQQANISDLAEDALAGVQFLKGRQDIDAKRIGLLGGSEGGWVVPLAASRSKDIAFIFVGSPSALSLAETIVYEVGAVGRERGFSEDEIKQMKAIRGLYNDALLTNIGWDLVRQVISESKEKRWFRYARVPQALPEPLPQAQIEKTRRQLDFDPQAVWEKTSIPVLAVWGELDRNVPARQSATRLKQYLDKAGNQDHTLVVFPKGNHEVLEAETGFDDEYLRLKRYVPGYFETTINWIQKRVNTTK
jgi:uncharacterized protein